MRTENTFTDIMHPYLVALIFRVLSLSEPPYNRTFLRSIAEDCSSFHVRTHTDTSVVYHIRRQKSTPFLKKTKKFPEKLLTKSFFSCIIIKPLREWRNRQTRTFEGRVISSYGFKSRFPHQQKRNFCLPKVPFLFIQVADLAYH